MSRFIEVHLSSSSEPRLCILNVDRVEYITPMDNGSLIHLASVDTDGRQESIDSRPFMLHVTEDYFTLKELLHCQ